jgi:hypothetical protein
MSNFVQSLEHSYAVRFENISTNYCYFPFGTLFLVIKWALLVSSLCCLTLNTGYKHTKPRKTISATLPLLRVHLMNHRHAITMPSKRSTNLKSNA